LGRLQQGCGLDRTTLARRLKYSRSQMYEILDGRISRPPEWDRLVEPLVRACTGNDERAVAVWRERHAVLVRVDSELRRQDRQDGQPRPVALAQVVPAQLPADVDVFTGREGELAELDRLLVPTDDKSTAAGVRGGGSAAVVISAVSGTAGVGKTALAVRWAHRVRRQFPDGQLYVNLRGYDPEQPLSAGDALAGFLRALGVTGQDIPLEVAERAASYRTLLDGRRMLVVLDNAGTVEQVRPLLPGTPSCTVVVTSRDSLAGLVARDGARRIILDLLPLHDAVALLQALIGARVEAEPGAAATLTGQCARLPLALRVAAELTAARPATSLTQLVNELADRQRRLKVLNAGGDPRTSVRSVFSWSYQHLPADATRAFRLIGLHPGSDLDPYAAAALTNTNLDQAHHLLDLLTRAHLIQPASRARYGMHDLLRAYATHLAAATDSKQERRAALTRLFDYYLATAAAAMDTLVPAEQHRRPRIPPSTTPSPSIADLAAARAWLDAERATLVATCAHTAAHGWLGHTTRLATTLLRYLDVGGHYPDALAIHNHALRAARHTSDYAAEAHALTNLGIVYWQQSRYAQAADHLQQAVTLAREISDHVAEARALIHLGIVYWQQSRYAQAADQLQQAVTFFREIGSDRAGEAMALTCLGLVYWRQGHYEQAADHQQRALTFFREIGERIGEAIALTGLGVVYWRQGRYEQAADHHQRALTFFREIGGDRVGEARALDSLGLVYREQGRYEQAADHHQRALTFFREIGDRAGEARALNGLGETLHAACQPDQARTHHVAALTLASQVGDRYEEARAHNGLAHTHQATGDPDQVRYHWCYAHILYADLCVPEVDDVHAHLSALDQAAGDKDVGL